VTVLTCDTENLGSSVAGELADQTADAAAGSRDEYHVAAADRDRTDHR
jgi:hypothetical protein